MSLPYLFLCLCLLGLAYAAIVLLLFTIVAWLQKWKILKWISTVASLGAVAAFMLLNYSLTSEGGRPSLRAPPVEESIHGIYALEGDSASDLRAKGYTNVSAQVVLKSDGTFEIRGMPHLWLYGGSYRAGYDSCWGKWRINKAYGARGHYYLAAWFDGFEPESAYHADADKAPRWVSLDLIAKTAKRPDYGLAVPLNCGDEGYIFFRKENANETVQRTGASGSAHETNRTSSAAGSRR